MTESPADNVASAQQESAERRVHARVNLSSHRVGRLEGRKSVLDGLAEGGKDLTRFGRYRLYDWVTGNSTIPNRGEHTPLITLSIPVIPRGMMNAALKRRTLPPLAHRSPMA